MSSVEAIKEKDGGATVLLLVQKLAVTAAALVFFAVFFWIARQMPPVRASGDVGSAFLPSILAVLGFCLSLFYLFQIVTGRDRTRAPVQAIALALLILTLAAVGSVYWLGMPVGLGIGAALMVLVLERGKRPFWAIGTGIMFWAMTQFGFGMLLGVPLL
ncbi:tripartite tricarboxylate transporter TctB family protein [Microvirga sp. TS319]|uniref:tripartite tricarboxylate transporter TctB family protein n=1 Tax=Microvirga sp. TS319 TaxID=3241165 RepID=UPI00351A76CE